MRVLSSREKGNQVRRYAEKGEKGRGGRRGKKDGGVTKGREKKEGGGERRRVFQSEW